jgi:outer membrane protein assembly factor BamB
MVNGSQEVWGLAQDDGRLLWRHALPGQLASRSPATSSPRLLLVWATTPANVHESVGGVDCIDGQTGALLWRHTVGHAVSYLRVALDHTHAYIGEVVAADSQAGSDEQSLRVTSLAAADGKPVWKGSYPLADVLVTVGRRLYGFAGSSGNDQQWCLWAVDAEKGARQRVVRGKPGFSLAYSSIERPIVLDESFLILGVRPGTGSDQRKPVICVDLTAGNVLRPWNYITSSSEARGGPIGGGSRAYFREDDTHLVAIQAR